MEFSDQTPPPSNGPSLEWAKEALDGRVAVIAGRRVGGVEFSKESRYGSPEQVSSIQIAYPGVTVMTVRHPSTSRPDVSIANLVHELTVFADIPDDLAGDEIEAWMLSRQGRPEPVLEASPAPLVIADEAFTCQRTSVNDGMNSKVAEIDGLVVIVAGKDIDRLELAWA